MCVMTCPATPGCLFSLKEDVYRDGRKGCRPENYRPIRRKKYNKCLEYITSLPNLCVDVTIPYHDIQVSCVMSCFCIIVYIHTKCSVHIDLKCLFFCPSLHMAHTTKQS